MSDTSAGILCQSASTTGGALIRFPVGPTTTISDRGPGVTRVEMIGATIRDV